MADSHAQLLRDALLNDESLVEAIFQGTRSGETPPWDRVTIRPVSLKSGRHLQFSYFDGTQDITKNFSNAEAAEYVDELLAHAFKSIQVSTTRESIRVQFSRKGRPIIHREQRKGQPIPIDLTHDRTKLGILSDEHPTPFLQAIGVMTAGGAVRADQRRKFRQINEFLRLIDETGEVDRLLSRPVSVVDLGCGSAALTFATYHYLNTVKGIPATLVGVDTKAHLMERHADTAASLGWDG
ncbi:MAG TPA: methyltransferase, partial [Promineifilum sp.]|nr:methyltransferase [Promineifilum sp.]